MILYTIVAVNQLFILQNDLKNLVLNGHVQTQMNRITIQMRLAKNINLNLLTN